jgi:hypothetical protein
MALNGEREKYFGALLQREADAAEAVCGAPGAGAGGDCGCAPEEVLHPLWVPVVCSGHVEADGGWSLIAHKMDVTMSPAGTAASRRTLSAAASAWFTTVPMQPLLAEDQAED